MAPETPGAQHELGALRDRRVPPTGVLPRHLQAWLMVGTALVIVLIILVAGHPQPASTPVARHADEPVPAQPGTVAHYAQQLAQAPYQPNVLPPGGPAIRRGAPAVAPTRPRSVEPLAAEVRSGEPSLFADNVVLSRRPAADRPSPAARAGGAPAGAQTGGAESPRAAAPSTAALAQLEQTLAQLASSAGRAAAPPATSDRGAAAAPDEGRNVEPPLAADPPHRLASDSAADRRTQENPAAGPRLRLLEGSVIETVLVTRMNGTFAGPVTCLVTTPVYSADRQYVLIPAGARVLGASSPVQSWGDSRLAVSFHRLLMPDGHTYSLDTFRGLDQAGEAGVTESVNRHYLEVFGASIAIGGLSGLSQVGTTGGFTATTFGDEYRQAAGTSLASSTSRVLDRYLNVLPTITIREGYRIKVYLTHDFELPAYAPASESGGVR